MRQCEKPFPNAEGILFENELQKIFGFEFLGQFG